MKERIDKDKMAFEKKKKMVVKQKKKGSDLKL